jgi:NAD(P)-dependent dehydrogenase (short-subunit alcohol dehydrogenase family)
LKLGLEGKSVLITGASKGIGLATARAFAQEGCALHLAARSAPLLESAAQSLTREYGVRVSVHPFDLSVSDNIVALARECARADILVNNAGEVPSGPIDALTDADWRRGFDLKLFGYINLSREIHGHMKARRSGVIVNDIGNSGENWDYNYIAGSTANAALMAFTRALGGVSLDYGVRVVGVNPGPVRTDRMEKINRRRSLDLYGDEGRWMELCSSFPGGRPAEADEVADLITFLASPRAAYISGTVVTIDGGISSRGSVIKVQAGADASA